ncbi:hypothetical protein RFI_33411, partial [Reticulomyxa filosa]
MKENYEAQLKAFESLLATHGSKMFSVCNVYLMYYILFFCVCPNAKSKHDACFDRHTNNWICNEKDKVNSGAINNEEIETIKQGMEDQLRKFQQQQIEHEKLQKSLQILKLDNASEMQQMLIVTNEQLAKKDDELLRQRWVVQ